MIPLVPLVFLDTETTGVHPSRKVWEVGMIRRDEFGQRETSFMIKTDLAQADPFGLGVGRFYERHPYGLSLSRASRRSNHPVPQQAPVLNGYEAALRVAEWTHDAHIVGAVPSFDTETLDGLLRGHGLIPAWHYHLIDVEALAVGYLHGRRASGGAEDVRVGDLPWKSDDLSWMCGVEPASDEERHTALGDAKWAMRLYDAITGGAS